jgi:hypothetical protein
MRLSKQRVQSIQKTIEQACELHASSMAEINLRYE